MSQHLTTQYTIFHRKYKPVQPYLQRGLSKGCRHKAERLEQSALRCHIMEGSKLYSCISKIGVEISHTPQQHNLLPHHSTATDTSASAHHRNTTVIHFFPFYSETESWF